jgi:hypothetical protein
MDDKETDVVQKNLKKSAHTAENPFLVRIQGIQPLDAYADPYTIYAFQNRNGFGSDIVSDHLIRQKSWEPMSVFTHITQLDSFARVSYVAYLYFLKREKVPRRKFFIRYIMLSLIQLFYFFSCLPTTTTWKTKKMQKMNLDRSEVYFVDIGANLGTFSLGVAAAGFKVIAIEAMSVNQFALSMSLCANIGMPEAVTVLSVALGKEAGQCTVFSARHNVLDGTLRCGEAAEKELLEQGQG